MLFHHHHQFHSLLGDQTEQVLMKRISWKTIKWPKWKNTLKYIKRSNERIIEKVCDFLFSFFPIFFFLCCVSKFICNFSSKLSQKNVRTKKKKKKESWFLCYSVVKFCVHKTYELYYEEGKEMQEHQINVLESRKKNIRRTTNHDSKNQNQNHRIRIRNRMRG